VEKADFEILICWYLPCVLSLSPRFLFSINDDDDVWNNEVQWWDS